MVVGEGLVKRAGKRILGIDGVTLASVNQYRRDIGKRPYQEGQLSALLVALTVENQVQPLVGAAVTEIFRRGSAIDVPNDYERHAQRVDKLAMFASAAVGILAGQLTHNVLDGVGAAVASKALVNVVSMEAGRRIVRKAPSKPSAR